MIGEAIRKLRRDRGLSQTELADRCGLTSLHISGFENGERRPNLDQLEKIADTFGVDMAYFLRKKQDIAGMTEEELFNCVNDNLQMILLMRKVLPFSSEKMAVMLSVADALSRHGGGELSCVIVEEEDWRDVQ